MFVAALAAFLLAAQTHATPVARDANPVDTARAFLTAYQNMCVFNSEVCHSLTCLNRDFKALAATTTPNYHFHDDVFDNLQSKLQSRDTSNVLNVPLDGVQSRAMFDWFISDQPNTNMIIEIADVSAVNATVVSGEYDASMSVADSRAGHRALHRQLRLRRGLWIEEPRHEPHHIHDDH